jgi:O-antigen/teichoic acid export membrane protein
VSERTQHPESKKISLGKGVLSVADQAVVSGTSFVTAVVIGRLCSKEELGVYSLALSALMLVRGVQGELVTSPYTIYSGRHQGKALAAYTGSSLVHYLLLTTLNTLCLILVAGVFSVGFGPTEAVTVAWVLAGAMPFMLLRDYLRQLSLAHLRVVAVIVLDACVTVIQLGGLLFLWWFSLLSVATVFVVMGAACAAAGLGWFLAAKQPISFVKFRFLSDWKANWSFARWALASFLIGSSTPVIMPWIVATTHGKAATGALAACVTLINCAGMYVTGVANLLSPRAARAYLHGGPAELSQTLGRAALMFVVTLGAFCLAIILTGDLPVRLVYGSRYSGVSTVLSLLALAMLVNSLGITAGNGLWAMDRPAAGFAADVCTFVVTVGLASVLVAPVGIFGAAVAILTGNCVGATVRFFTLSRLLAAHGHGPKPAADVPQAEACGYEAVDSSRRLQPASGVPQAEACGNEGNAPIIGEPSRV